MDYQETLDWIHGTGRFGIRPGLERMQKMMEFLGNPHLELKVIHLAGTNGKGSTAAFLSRILEEGGFRTALYTSPYLEAFTNRMAINRRDIDRERLVQLAATVKPLVEKVSQDPALGPMTEFEVVTSLAFQYFAEENPDFLVLEVGLGGRLDATNVVGTPLVAVITNIGLEHTEVLGDTIGKIAGEKAGIIKEGGRVVTAASRPEALEVIRQKCREKGAHLIELGSQVTWETLSSSLEGQRFNYYSREGLKLEDLFIPFLGEHQVINASTAVAVVEDLARQGTGLGPPAIRRGLAEARWGGRLEILGRDPLLILDAAHNLDGVRSLRQAVTGQLKYRKLILVLGILGDKAYGDMLGEIVPLADWVIITRPDSPRATDSRGIAREARKYSTRDIIVQENIPRAVDSALSLAGPRDLVLVSGSLYTISQARDYLIRRAPGS